jgi:uncharacterized protein YbaR (Trm112 family)
MKKDTLDILCCPTCKADLNLKIDLEKDNEIIKGSLTCIKCKNKYEINDGIPELLPK